MPVIRSMQREDLPSAAGLEERCFTVPWSEKLLAKCLESPLDQVWVLEDGGEIAGYCNLRIIAGEGELMRIAVHPAKRGRGYARELMEELEKHASENGAQSLSLEVRASNLPAICLYKSYGYEIRAVRKRYYTHPVEDAYIMQHRCN